MESVWAVEHRLYRLGDEETERLTCPAFRALGGAINWQFTAEDARIKLVRLYPSIDG